MRDRRRVPGRTLAALAIAGAFALSACGPNQLGAAAIVENHRITMSQVQGALDEVREERAALGLSDDLGHDAAQQEVLRRVLGLVFEQAARDLGITVTAGDVAEARAGDDRTADQIREIAAQNNVSMASLKDLFRQATIEQKIVNRLQQLNPGASDDEISGLYSERLVATATAMDIRINPRYGQFNSEQGSIERSAPDFLQVSES